jgi:hypothetical protein
MASPKWASLPDEVQKDLIHWSISRTRKAARDRLLMRWRSLVDKINRLKLEEMGQ